MKNHPKILIVEDNKEILEYYKKSLPQIFPDNYIFEFVDDPEHGLRRCVQNSFDLLMTSVHFENTEINGFKLGQAASVAGKRVIFVTSDNIIKRLSYYIHYFDLIKNSIYIPKPATALEIFTKITNVLSKGKKDQDAIFKKLIYKCRRSTF